MTASIYQTSQPAYCQGGTLCKGNLVPWSRSKLHIKYLEPRQSFGPKGVPSPLLEPYCYHSYRQPHSGCLFKEGGGSKSRPLCALLWRILTWCSRKQAQARHIHASTMSRPGIHIASSSECPRVAQHALVLGPSGHVEPNPIVPSQPVDLAIQ